MTKTEKEAIGSLVAAIYGELAELHNAVAALNETVRRLTPVSYGVEGDDNVTIA